MRRAARQPAAAGGQDYLATVSDLMSGLIFIFIITLAVFALLLAKKQQEAEAERAEFEASKRELTDSRKIQEWIVTTIKERLPGLDVEVDADHGVVRLNERVVGFELAKAEPRIGDLENIRAVARVLREVLSCFVAQPGEARSAGCPEDLGRARVDTVMVEGHTDALATDPRLFYEGNLGLSTARAAKVMRLMEAAEAPLSTMRNSSDRPVLSVSGYGESRLLPGLEEDDPRHRRIDIRFLMELPTEREPEPVERTREGLDP